MVGHGFAWHDGDRHEEIFLDDHKELTVLTSDSIAVEAVLQSEKGSTHYKNVPAFPASQSQWV